MNYKYNPECVFASPLVGGVITVYEARIMWGKTERQIMYAIWRDQIHARLSVGAGSTGRGIWLLSLSSCLRVWGQPQIDLINKLHKGE